MALLGDKPDGKFCKSIRSRFEAEGKAVVGEYLANQGKAYPLTVLFGGKEWSK